VCPAGAEYAKQALQGVLLLPSPAFVGAVWLFMAHLMPFPLTPIPSIQMVCSTQRMYHTLRACESDMLTAITWQHLP
jgi:hypothetical protein